MVILKDLREGGGHERFAKANHVANQDAIALVEMMSGDLYGGGLILEQLVPELRRDTKLRKAVSRFPSQMISDLNVNVIRRNDLLARPTLLDDLDEFG